MKTILSILLSFLVLSALGQASTVTYADKDRNLPNTDPRKIFRDIDANELKSVINQHAGLIDTHTSQIATKQATLVSGTNVKTVNGTSIVGSGDVDLIDDAIVNGETKAPTQNAVFDADALRVLLTAFVDAEVPSGTINGSNPTFTIANTPVSGSLQLSQNGIILTGGGVDYTLSGTTVTFVTAPLGGDQLLAFYRK